MSEKTIINKTETCALFGCASPTFIKYINHGMPFIQRGKRGSRHPDWQLDRDKALAWYSENVTKTKSKREGFDQARTRKVSADASLAELELSIKQGQVVKIEDVASIVEHEYANVRARLLAIPHKLAPLMYINDDLTECKEIIDDAIREALEELTGNVEEKVTRSTQ